jgi:3-phosphoshikimate 1-carboxyvinyltransferase
VEVRGRGSLRGGTFDLGALSDTAPTLAAIAPFADGPVEVTGIGFIRHKESDRVAAPVAELRRLGITARETADGFVVEPGTPRPRQPVETYDDHRMAMAFSVIGLVVPGLQIDGPDCVAKTFPGYFDALDALTAPR